MDEEIKFNYLKIVSALNFLRRRRLQTALFPCLSLLIAKISRVKLKPEETHYQLQLYQLRIRKPFGES